MTGSVSTQVSDEPYKSRSAENPTYAVARAFLFDAIAVCLLLWVAFYNGYPTVYPDTGSYLLTSAFHVVFQPYRAPVYSKFIELTGLGTTAWYTVAVQAILVVIVLREACKFLIGGQSKFRDYCFLAVVCALAAFTSLPWEASQLMPDVFAGTAFLSMFLLAFNGELLTLERVILALILTISVGAHMSLFPIAAAFAAALLVPRLLNWRVPSLPVKVLLAWLLVPVAAAGLWTATLNRELGLGFEVSPSGNEFFLASLFGKGLVADYLHENCPAHPFVACRYLGNLPKTPEQFMFWSPILHEMDANGNEMRALVRGTLAAHPFKFVAYSSEDTLLQFVENRTGDEIRAIDLGAPNSNGEDILQVFPGDAQAFARDKQSHSGMSRFTNILSIVHIVVFWLSLLGCVYFVRNNLVSRGRASDGLVSNGLAGDDLASDDLLRKGRAARLPGMKLNELFYSAIVYLFINAAICATFAGAYERYQARVAWIIPLCLAFYFCELFRQRGERIGETAAFSS